MPIPLQPLEYTSVDELMRGDVINPAGDYVTDVGPETSSGFRVIDTIRGNRMTLRGHDKLPKYGNVLKDASLLDSK